MKTKKGFTLIELMVAMGIIAVLVTMSVVAIQIVQRSLRDTQRRDVINTMNLWLAGYYNNNQEYPDATDLSFTEDEIEFVGVTPAEQIVELNGATSAATETDSSGTDYCYESPGGQATFRLGAELENGGEIQIGNDPTDCTAFGT